MSRTFWIRFALLVFVAGVPFTLAALTPSSSPNLKEIAQRAAQELDRLLQLRAQQTFTIAAFPSIRAYAATSPETRSQRAAIALNELQAWVASDTHVREVVITDEQGIVIMATREGWNEDISARKFVQDALRGQLAVSPIAQDRDEFSTYYAAPILDNRKEIAGALVIRVAAQEMWSVTPRGENFYAVISDENGVRLDDSGNPARRLTSFGPLDAPRAAQISRAHVYGAQLPQPRATTLTRAQELVTRGALDELTARDFDAGALAAQRLVSRPWYVLALAPAPTFVDLGWRFGVPLIAAILLAFGGALLLNRL